MAGSRCRVSYTDPEGIIHAMDVDAESLYEAVAIAVAEFREDALNQSMTGPMTEFSVSVYRKPTERSIRLTQVKKWAEHTTKDGPARITKDQAAASAGPPWRALRRWETGLSGHLKSP